MNENRYCFICDAKITRAKIDERETLICKKCRFVTGGYKKEEKYLVKELRDELNEDEHWRIDNIVWIVRRYLKRRKNNE